MAVRVVSAALFLVLAGCSGGPPPLEPPPALDAGKALDFGPVVVDGRFPRSIPVHSLSATEGFLRARTDGPFVFAGPPQLWLGADETVYLDIAFAPRTVGPATGWLVVELESDPGRPINLRLTGEGVLPALDTSQAVVAYDEVPLGAWLPRSIVLHNGSRVTTPVVPIFEKGSSSAFFIPDRNPGTTQHEGQPPLLAGDDGVVQVLFMPDEAGPQAATLQFRACTACPTTRVELRGTGVYPTVLFQPRKVDFGPVLVGEALETEVELLEPEWQLPFRVTSATITGDDVAAFEVEKRAYPLTMDPGSLTLGLRYQPISAGAASAELRVETDGGQVVLPLRGLGKSLEIVADPQVADFGLWPPETVQEMAVHVSRADGVVEPLPIASARIEGNAAFSSPELPKDDFELTAAGLWIPIKLFAQESGLASAALVIDPGLPGGVQLRVPLRASISPSGFCSLWVSPGSLRFGLRPVGSLVQRTIRLHNPGAKSCSFGDLEVDGSPGFSLAAPWPDMKTLASGQSADVVVNYRPSDDGSDLDRAELRLRQPNRSVPLLTVQVSGQGGGSLTIDKPSFAPVAVGELGIASVMLRNWGRSTVHIRSVTLAKGDRSAFSVAAGAPVEIGPETSSSVTLTFAPRRVGSDGDELEILTDASQEPVIATLSSQGLAACSDGCGLPKVSCPTTIDAPAYDWVKLGTGAIDSRGGKIDCSISVVKGSRSPQMIVPRGCDADVVLDGPGTYDLKLTARDVRGGEQSCRIKVEARAKDMLVIRSWPDPDDGGLDLRLFHPDAGDPSEPKTWSSNDGCSEDNTNPSWNDPISPMDDPVFHGGRNGMPDVIRIPEPSQRSKLGVGVRWASGTAGKLTASTEIFCDHESKVFSSVMNAPSQAVHVADVTYKGLGECVIESVDETLLAP